MIDAIQTPVLRVLSLLLLGGGGAWCCFALAEARVAELSQWLMRYERELARDLSFLRLDVSARQVTCAELALVVGAALLLVFQHLLAASALVVLLLAVRPWLSTRRAKRVTEIEVLLDGFLEQLASTLRITPSLGEALAYTATLVAAPLSEELETLTKETELGTPLEDALNRFSARMGSRSVESALSAIRIGRRTGGDLPGILERSAHTLREMARLEGVVRTKTAEGKAQAFVVAALPFPMIGILHYLDPGFLRPLTSSPMGYVVVGISVALWGASIVIARRILDVDI